MIYGMMIVRNEAERYLDKVLQQMVQICDKVIILDDNSNDNTVEVCESYGCEVYQTDKRIWDKNESILRQQLWDLVTNQAEEGDWILCLDADEYFNSKHLPFIDYLFNTVSNEVDGIGFKLYDMWNNREYRDDEYWQAHKHYWCMAIRYTTQVKYQWNNKALHGGRFPFNASQRMLPTEIPILHMGWATEHSRSLKYNRYKRLDSNAQYGWKEQYESILDKNPNLKQFYF